MDQTYFREQADRCRRLARDSSDFALQVSLRRMADEYQTIADELEDEEISASTLFDSMSKPKWRGSPLESTTCLKLIHPSCPSPKSRGRAAHSANLA